MSSPITYTGRLREKGIVKQTLAKTGVISAPILTVLGATMIVGGFDHRAAMIGASLWLGESIVFDNLLRRSEI